jgi:hypothetical protein
MHLPQIHNEVLYIAIQYIKQNNLTIDFDLINTIFDINEIDEFLDRIDLKENDIYVVFEYYSNHTYYDMIYYNGSEYYIHNEISLMLLINDGGLSEILKEYFKLYYTKYIDDFIYKYNYPKEQLLLNHFAYDICCIEFGRLYDYEKYIE